MSPNARRGRGPPKASGPRAPVIMAADTRRARDGFCTGPGGALESTRGKKSRAILGTDEEVPRLRDINHRGLRGHKARRKLQDIPEELFPCGARLAGRSDLRSYGRTDPKGPAHALPAERDPRGGTY